MVFYILLMEVNLKDNLLMVKQMGQVVLWIKMGIL